MSNKNNLVNSLTVNKEFKHKILCFISILENICKNCKIEIKEIKEEVIVFADNIKIIKKEIIDNFKSISVNEEGKDEKIIKILSKAYINNGKFEFHLLNYERKYVKSSYNVVKKFQKKSIKKEKINAIKKNLQIFFDNCDEDIQTLFFESKNFEKTSNIWRTLHKEHFMISNSTKIYISNDQNIITFKETHDTLDLIAFFEKIHLFNKNNEIESVTIEMDEGKITLIFDLEYVNDKKRKYEDDEKENKNKKLNKN